ncbi:SOS response-associated peptidase [Phyllobacterium sp. SB3]|uniref:SOS response-associated peptidase n=1 Tax=Phyllobacterium sp. SB3 TaxID=3156073 RepID=UPI0032AF5A53
MMSATPFDFDAPLDTLRIIIRRDRGDVEMVKLPWGLKPREGDSRPFTVIRAEDRVFPDHRCLVPASEFRHRSQGKSYSFSLVSGDFFYFAGIWRPASRDWPESYAILTTVANDDVAPYHDRQMAVLTRDRRMAWLDHSIAEGELLQPQPAGSYRVKRLRAAEDQPALL